MTELSTAQAHLVQRQTMTGIGYALAGFSIFSMQDATVKWLAASLPIWEILFFRSLMIILLVTIVTGPRNLGAILINPNRMTLLGRGLLILVAWLAYFTAARSLHLAELLTLYFSTPVFVVILSVVMLRERVTAMRWAGTIFGFIGVVIAANPGLSMDIVPVCLTLFAAGCWALTNILVRLISRTETTLNLMVASSILFVVVCGVALPFIWVTPDLLSIGLMIGLGFIGGLGQYMLFEGYRLAPASAVAPFEYVTLVWAFAWGFLIWGDWPAPAVFIGATVIFVSGLTMIGIENHMLRRLRRS
jgi:S-adenosylmethionine uptake transporter